MHASPPPESARPARQRTDPGVVAGRVAERRAHLGLSEADLAVRAGMAPPYLEHLLEAGPEFDPGGYLRIAAALRTTYQDLLEGRSDLPPGQSGASPRPVLIHLNGAECWDLLGSHGVGRIALPGEPGPVVLPVNYTVDVETVVYRTNPRGAAAVEAGTGLSFQADRIDDRLSQGWSVLVVGTAEHIEDPETVRLLTEAKAAEPWAGGSRPLWIRIRPERVSGRRIGTL
ncbi:pyridoxamine 5'-phosphate oxidase family protein [Kitasatospora sp. NBC_00315]|uniref:pyridoxamine 5'-phosphate oxidase family protein n=1 Tax=Kitasatospora sp. NBC_00315 TaxID=2975963 RepID=UPI0032460C83